MKIFSHRTLCGARVACPKLSDLVNTWVQPDVSSNETHEAFQRLVSESKTVETVFPFLLGRHRAKARCQCEDGMHSHVL
jgi:hypothetical protein